MKSLTRYGAGQAIGWLIVGLTVLPLLAASAESDAAASEDERLEWMLAKHDVRQVIYASHAASSDCLGSAAENGR